EYAAGPRRRTQPPLLLRVDPPLRIQTTKECIPIKQLGRHVGATRSHDRPRLSEGERQPALTYQQSKPTVQSSAQHRPAVTHSAADQVVERQCLPTGKRGHLNHVYLAIAPYRVDKKTDYLSVVNHLCRHDSFEFPRLYQAQHQPLEGMCIVFRH